MWRRWSPERLESRHFHNAVKIELNDPPHILPGSVAVLVDDTGMLVEASVIVAPLPHDVTTEADLDPLLVRVSPAT